MLWTTVPPKLNMTNVTAIPLCVCIVLYSLTGTVKWDGKCRHCREWNTAQSPLPGRNGLCGQCWACYNSHELKLIPNIYTLYKYSWGLIRCRKWILGLDKPASTPLSLLRCEIGILLPTLERAVIGITQDYVWKTPRIDHIRWQRLDMLWLPNISSILSIFSENTHISTKMVYWMVNLSAYRNGQGTQSYLEEPAWFKEVVF